MEFTKEFIETNKLSAEQVTALVDATNDNEAEIKKTYDGKANTDAEAILEGAAKKVAEQTGIQREQGQKIADYLNVVGESYPKGKLESERKKLADKQKELDEAIKNGKPDVLLQGQFDEIKGKFDTLQAKEAEFDRVKEGDFETKYTELFASHSQAQETRAFDKVRPAFPDTVNKYEADAKWNSFIKDVKVKYNVEIDKDGDGHAIDKENKHKTYKLSDLVAKDKDITALKTGREQKGAGGDPDVKMIDIEKIPFKVPENATAQQRQQAITDYLTKTLKLSKISSEYSEKFNEYNKQILNPQKTAPEK